MKNFKLLFPICILFLGLIWGGCGDDPAEPQDVLKRSDLEGSWELVRVVAGSVSNDLPSGNSYWYFTDNGEMCSLWRTAYGEYYNGYPGQVSEDAKQLFQTLENGEAVFDLTCWAENDSMGLEVASPDTLNYDKLFFFRVNEAPEPTCFEAR